TTLFRSARVERHGAALELRIRPAAGAAQQRLQARQHLLEMEGLRDVIVSPGLQALDLVLPAVARGEDQDGKSLVLGAQPADDLQAGELRQTEIDDRDVERVFAPCEEALFAVLRHIDGEPRIRKTRLQRLAQRSLVFDYKHSHWQTPREPNR